MTLIRVYLGNHADIDVRSRAEIVEDSGSDGLPHQLFCLASLHVLLEAEGRMEVLKQERVQP